MIDQGAKLSVKRQCELLDLNRTGVYYTPRPIPEQDLRLMRRIDELHLEHPFYGARRLAKQLERESFDVGRLHVTTLMRRMGIEALYRRPRTSIPARDAKIYPYLLDGLAIERPNQVWASDLTYLPMAHGFLYLVAILDVASRKVLSFRVSNTMTPDFCVDALTEAIARYGAPEIVNTDQGSQFTSKAWTDVLNGAGVRISMDGKGRWIDNVFIERLWRLCAHGGYVAESARRVGFTVDARRMRAHNEGMPGVHCKGPRRLKDDCGRVRAGRTRYERGMRRPSVLKRLQPVQQ
jgi:putative transposase